MADLNLAEALEAANQIVTKIVRPLASLPEILAVVQDAENRIAQAKHAVQDIEHQKDTAELELTALQSQKASLTDDVAKLKAKLAQATIENGKAIQELNATLRTQRLDGEKAWETYETGNANKRKALEVETAELQDKVNSLKSELEAMKRRVAGV